MTNDPPDPAAPQDPAFLPTGRYDESALNRARSLLDAMPESVGPYRVLERLGGGGMGEVYRAEQRSPIRRDVALKFIKLGMDTKLVIARFEAERQALALMDHPHIAKVFDAGTDDTGRPYFVMEYVKGKPITEYADQNHLSISERLELFEQVCQAVQHAHHKGVIHRDLKPGNVLVSTQDGKPFAKVIDFGIAKAIAQRLTDQTLFTEHAQFVGTPQYMSPEQAEGSVDIDTRTDVYSLGVMLYELLTGSTPFSSQELKAAAFEQIKKMIVEVDPPKPSTRLSLSQPTLSTLAASRRTEPKRLGTLVRGELDWIVMKALDKDRKRRYETPTSLANDIEAHRTGEPVQAAPPSTAYRIQKFVRKHRGPVIAVATVGIVLLLGIIGTTWGYLVAERTAEREREAKDRERLAKEEATEQRDAATEAREQAVAARNEAVAAQDLAEGALARGFLRPLVGSYALAQTEIEALWELATLESDTIGARMFGEATRDPQMTVQLLECAEPAVVAAIGLNPELRQRVFNLLRPRLNDPMLTISHRAGIAWLTLMLIDQSGQDSAACVAAIKDAIAAEDRSPTAAQSNGVNHADRFAALIAPEPATELLQAIVASSKQKADVRYWLAHHLATSAGRLQPRLAAQVCTTASAALLVETADAKRTAYELSELANAMAALSARMEPEAASRICASASPVVLAAAANPKWPAHERFRLTHALATLAARLEPDAAARIADGLLVGLADPASGGSERARLVNELGEVSARLQPDAAARVCESASNQLLKFHTFDDVGQGNASDLAQGLVTLSARLPPDAAARICESASNQLLKALTADEPWTNASDLAKGLAMLTARLPPDAAARLCESATKVLLAAVADKEQPAYRRCWHAEGLATLSARLEPEATARICESTSDELLTAAVDERQPEFASLVASRLVELAAHLPPDVAARVCGAASDKLLAALADPKWDGSWSNPKSISASGQAVTALSERLESVAATRFCESASVLLLANFADPKRTSGELLACATELAALSARLSPDAAARICRAASDRMFKAFTDQDPTVSGTSTNDWTVIPRIANVIDSLNALAAASERMEPGRAQAIASRAIRSVTEEHLLTLRSHHTLDGLIESMALVCRNFTPPLRQAVLQQLLALRLEQPYEDYADAMQLGPIPPTLVHRTLVAMQRLEPHDSAMVARSGVPEAAIVSTEHAFSTLKLTTPGIIEFLKSPLIYDSDRRDFLDLLECRYGRRFGNQWAFVEYAQAENLGLDFTTRAKRPDPQAILKNIHKLIDDELAKP